MKTLSVGARGAEVCVLQTRLNSKPPTALVPLSADGIFGSKTVARVREFQKSAGLAVDAIVGPKTWGALLTPEPASKLALRFCDDVLKPNATATSSQQVTHGFKAASFAPVTASSVALAGLSMPSLPSLPKLRALTATEIATATGVYGSSIDFSTVTVSDKTGIGGRAFVLAVPIPFGKARQVMNVGASPSRDTLIHELAHVWQSQHHGDPTRYMVNAVESQALAEATNLIKSSTSFSAYGYRPGKPFGEYGAEQIAQQVMRGEAPIIAHVRKIAAGKVDPENVASLNSARIEDTSLPGVKT